MTWRARCGDACGTVRRYAERLLECATEVVGAQTGDLGEGGERDLLVEVLLDVPRDGSLLPAGKAAPDRRLDARSSRAEAHGLMRRCREIRSKAGRLSEGFRSMPSA
jgi:hypothetical protein